MDLVTVLTVVWRAILLISATIYIRSYDPPVLLITFLVPLQLAPLQPLYRLLLPILWLFRELSMRLSSSHRIEENRSLPHSPRKDLSIGRRIGSAHEVDRLYYFDSDTPPTALRTSVDSFMWHCRIGHPPADRLQHSLVVSISVSHFHCQSCQHGKHHRIFFLSRCQSSSQGTAP
ncbi:uncharacterized protein LOC143886900 isoform X2 [Tasmannia lanceolata]|uniref:uncharacterized protein LOC143886900 isoform X2 n=1 Tax=Tasmannia lanceolata TaxID=3420 RepID=UPI004063F77D